MSDGWIVESTARLLPGSTVDVVLAPGRDGQVKRAVIARCEVVALDRRHGIRCRARLRIAADSASPARTRGPAGGNALPVCHGNPLVAAALQPPECGNARVPSWHAD